MTASNRVTSEAGDTLVEVIISLALMGIALVAILSGIGSAVSLSVVHRGQTDVSAALVSAAEFLKSESYAPCCHVAGCTPDNPGIPADPVSTFNDDLKSLTLAQQDVTAPTVTAVTDIGGAACSSPSTATDPGLELVAIQATGGGGRVTQTMYVVKAERT